MYIQEQSLLLPLATGEVMSICNNFEGALMKAIRSLEQHVECLLDYDFSELNDEELEEMLHKVDDRRIWVIAEALRRGVSYDHIHEITMIDKWFKCPCTMYRTEVKLNTLSDTDRT